MDHAKKLVLIEPRVLEQLQAHAEYKELQKPTDKKTKAILSVELQKMLEDNSIGDDLKAKMYRQTFSKFRTMRDEIPEPYKVGINALTPPVRPRLQQATTSPGLRLQKHATRRRSKTSVWDQY